MVLDYVELLSPFELERIAAAVSEHIRTGEFFPKVSELINRCQPKFKSPPPKNVLNDTKQLEYEGPDLETRKRGVAHWERIKAQMIEAVEERADKPKPWREGGSDEFSKLVG